MLDDATRSRGRGDGGTEFRSGAMVLRNGGVCGREFETQRKRNTSCSSDSMQLNYIVRAA